MRMYIGLDVHFKGSVYVAEDEEGKRVGQGEVPTSEEGLRRMVEATGAPAGTKVGLETGTQSTWAARVLWGLGMEPVVINAAEVRAKAQRKKQKSDFRDAQEICGGIRREIYGSIVYVPEPGVERLRRILSRRRHFVGKATSQINAAMFLLRASGLREEVSSLDTKRSWEAMLSNDALKEVAKYLRMHFEMWKVASRNVEELDAELEEAVEPFRETVDLLRTVKGVGPVVSAAFVAAIGRPDRFPESGKVVSYLGLAPSGHDSGERERHGKITKEGSSYTRAMLCEAAQHASRATHPLNPYFVRAYAKRGYQKAVVMVAQRLARMLWRMWLDKKEFDVGKLRVIEERHVRKRTCYYRLPTARDDRKGSPERTAAALAVAGPAPGGVEPSAGPGA
jgi:transposase